MNTLVVGTLFTLWLIAGYRFYGRRIARKLINPDDTRTTPGRSRADGVDYHAARTSVVFGHHFSSIAGAGPIIGPLLGVRFFGWLPSLLWIALGSVFIGAVHDYISLMASIRNSGRSLGDIAEKNLGRRACVILSIFLWCALVLVVAVFGVITAQTFVDQPSIVLPTFGLIFVAMIFGTLVLRRGMPLWPGTLISLGVLAVLIRLGQLYPLAISGPLLGLAPLTIWFWILMIYCLAASILPVWLLLQPRDYLSTWILYLGLGGGVLGLLVAHPHIGAPVMMNFKSSVQGPMLPMLFVMIACGAISGFHSLVASGTTSKQLDRESDGLRVGYGAMILEAALAGLVILIAAGALDWDASTTPAVGSLQYILDQGGGPIIAFATGFSRLVDALPGLSASAGLFFGILMINAFVITTLDTSTRLGRFILEELTVDIPLLGNRWSATLLTVGAAAWLGASNSYTRIWPVFGATNQLVAALALIVISSWLVGVGKPRAYTLIPAIFMLITSISALLWQTSQFLAVRQYLLATVASGLTILALVIVYEARVVLRKEAR